MPVTRSVIAEGDTAGNAELADCEHSRGSLVCVRIDHSLLRFVLRLNGPRSFPLCLHRLQEASCIRQTQHHDDSSNGSNQRSPKPAVLSLQFGNTLFQVHCSTLLISAVGKSTANGVLASKV